jgi:hypothetical protein
MAKSRVPIPDQVRANVLYGSHHTCAICNESGRPVQIHHINDDPSDNREENLAVLCLLCHDKTQVAGGFGRRLDAVVVRRYRDEWVKRVSERRAAAVRAATGSDAVSARSPSRASLLAYVHVLPDALRRSVEQVEAASPGAAAIEAAERWYEVVDLLSQIVVQLAAWLPPNHFGGEPTERFVDTLVHQRLVWHYALAEPTGEGGLGSMMAAATAGGAIHDLHADVSLLVRALLWGQGRLDDWEPWRAGWRAALPDSFRPGRT